MTGIFSQFHIYKVMIKAKKLREIVSIEIYICSVLGVDAVMEELRKSCVLD